jgi:hypothetical protein
LANNIDGQIEASASTTELGTEGLASRFLAQAKKAGEQVQASAADLTSKAFDLKAQAAVAASELGDITAAKMGELKEAGLAALSVALDDFNAALPAAHEAGYNLQTLNVGLGLPPQVTATFAASKDVSAENVERVLATHADRKFTVVLIKSLYQASQIQNKLRIGALKPATLSVALGLPPSVSINFT